ncbi:response regulator transcription factor [Streptomyces sp. NPDC086777]|uniref:LytR/AlgR family response regulator transcription factor n=1 Tax=Streptomyces sp. NPDC086777 TaxID=3154866 RepID=UPI00344B17DB
MRCIIVDDCPHFLRAARCLLKVQGVEVVGMASDSAQALRQAEQLKPDVALVDIDLGGECGLELAGRMRLETGPSPPRVILVSVHAEDEYSGMIEESAAVGFLAKATLSGNAIRALLAAADEDHHDRSITWPPET